MIATISHNRRPDTVLSIRSKSFSAVCLVLVLLLSSLASAQPAPKETTSKLAAKDKRELQRLAKLFVRRFQQTRDIKPLIKEFFVSRFPDCLIDYSDEEFAKSHLTSEQFIRAYFVIMNFQYIYQTALMYGWDIDGDEKVLANMFPANLAKQINSIGLFPDLLLEPKGPDRKDFLEQLTHVERTARSAQKHLKAKNYEQTSRYQKQFREFQNSDWLGYVIKPDKGDIPCAEQSKQLETISYKVTTPIWFVLEFVKVNGRYKIVSIDIYDD